MKPPISPKQASFCWRLGRAKMAKIIGNKGIKCIGIFLCIVALQPHLQNLYGVIQRARLLGINRTALNKSGTLVYLYCHCCGYLGIRLDHHYVLRDISESMPGK